MAEPAPDLPMRRATPICLCIALLAGCARMPDLGAGGRAAAAAGGPYPSLQPLPELAARSATVTDAAMLDQRAAATDARLAALRARAAALAPPVLDAATLARLNAALAARDGA